MGGLGLFTRNAQTPRDTRGYDACEHNDHVSPTAFAVDNLVAVRCWILDPALVPAAVRWQLRVAVGAHKTKIARSAVVPTPVDMVEDHGDGLAVPTLTRRVQLAARDVATDRQPLLSTPYRIGSTDGALTNWRLPVVKRLFDGELALPHKSPNVIY